MIHIIPADTDSGCNLLVMQQPSLSFSGTTFHSKQNDALRTYNTKNSYGAADVGRNSINSKGDFENLEALSFNFFMNDIVVLSAALLT